MSLIRRATAPVERRSNDSLAALAARYAPTGSSGQIVTSDTAMRHAAWWACVRLLSDIVASLPVDTYRDVPGEQTVEIASPALVRTPSTLVPWTAWVSQVMMSLLTRGNAYGLVTQTSAGFATRVEIASPDDITVEQPVPLGPVTYRWRGRPQPADAVWHVAAFVPPGSPVGLSPVRYAASTLGIGLAADDHMARYFSDGLHPTQVLGSDQVVTKEQAEQAKDAYVRAVGDSRSPVVLGGGLKPIPMQISPEDAQVLEEQRYSVTQVARIFGVPPEMIGAAADGSGSITYANREQRAVDLLTYTVQPWLVRLEEAISRLLPRPQRVRFNVDAVLRSDLLTRYQAYAIGLKHGFLVPNEPRGLEDLPPLPGGDTATPAPAPAQEAPVDAAP